MGGHRGRYHAGHCLDPGDRQFVIQRPDLALGLLSKRRSVGVTPDNKIHPSLPGLIQLSIRVVEGGFLRPAQSEVPDVAYNSDDRHPVGRILACPEYSSADRALIGKVLSDE